MFNSQFDEEQYIEREDDFDNTESNSYIASVYAQLSLSYAANDAVRASVNSIDR